jgi:hypothetical protein
MSGLIDIIRRVVQQELVRNRGCRLGVVTAVFPHQSDDDQNNYEVDVRLKHEDLELRKVPLAVGHVGVVAPARVGDLVLVQFVDGDINQALVTGRFYHDDERPPLHKEDEILFEQRVPDGTLNHLRFTDDGTIYIQRDVAKPEDNSEAKAGITLDKDGNITIQAGEKVTVTISNDDNITIKAGDETYITVTKDSSIQIKAGGQAVSVDCDALTVNGKMTVNGETTINADLIVSGAGKTTISGNTITGE